MKKILVIAILCVSALGCAVMSFAWFTPAGAKFPDCSATLSADYFAGGDGLTKETAFILDSPIHVYNLTWLQHKGVFNDKTYYFKISDDASVIDMKAADSPVKGAIPPIGGTNNPFKGYFDGNGKTISNLWVSSDPADWSPKPDGYDENAVGSDIGMFGYIEKNETDVTYVGNFYLENVEVTTTVSEVSETAGYVGIIAGKVAGSLSKVGVINGKISAKSGAIPVSEYTLVGKTDDAVEWTDAPGALGGGGNLVIQPNTTSGDYGITQAFTSANSGATLKNSTQAVPGSIDGTAYFKAGTSTSSIKITDVKGGYLGFKMYKTAYLDYQNGVIIGTSSDTTGFYENKSLPTNPTKEQQAFYDYYTECSQNGKYNVIEISDNSNIANGVAIDSLTNCVWFKPQAAGKCALSFIHQSQSSTDHMSLFRFIRTDNKVSGLQEMTFELNKTNGNKNANFYVVNIGADDLKYEYAIALGSKDTSHNAQFFYMMLAGADKTTGTANLGTGKVLEQIDFLYETPSDFTSMHLPVLAINSGTTVSTNALQSFRFAVFDDGNVHYYTDGNVAVTEVVQAASTTKENDESGFTTPINNPYASDSSA